MPFKNSFNKLGNSYQMIINKFEQIERRLDKNLQIKVNYREFMEEYLRLWHIRQVEINDDKSSKGYFTPHHVVFKELSLPTKYRVVFDCSIKTYPGVSLNDVICVGSKL